MSPYLREEHELGRTEGERSRYSEEICLRDRHCHLSMSVRIHRSGMEGPQ